MRIVLVTHDSVFGRYLAASLHAAGVVDRIVIETGRPSPRYWWRRLRRVGAVDFVFQAALSRWLVSEGARHLPALALPPHERTASANRHGFAPDELPLGFGSSYITARTLAGLPHGFLNLHTGWLPAYRGAKSEFWTLYHDDRERAGWTLHFMTPRLDEGDIVARGRVGVDGENPASLRAALLRDAATTLVPVLEQVRASGVTALARIPQGEGRYFSAPRWSDWRRYRRGERASFSRLPDVTG